MKEAFGYKVQQEAKKNMYFFSYPPSPPFRFGYSSLEGFVKRHHK